jgi:hypothetical protein
MADKCEAYRFLIEEGAGGGVAPEARALRSHLEACAGCREFRREREALVGLLGGLEKVNAPDDFEFRLRARIAARRGSPSASFWQLRFTPGLAALAVATCMLAAATVYFRTRQDANHTDIAAASRQTAPAPAPGVREAKDETTAPANEVAEGDAPALAVHAPPRTPPRPRRDAAAGYAAAEKRNALKPRRAVNEGSFVARGAAVITGPEGAEGRAPAQRSGSEAVALRTSPETLRVVLRDERGAPYLMPMRSVSFGSQTPVGRAAQTTRVSLSDKGGVW